MNRQGRCALFYREGYGVLVDKKIVGVIGILDMEKISKCVNYKDENHFGIFIDKYKN